MTNIEYEWMAMSQWLAEHPGKDPDEDNWEFEWGALRRKKSNMNIKTDTYTNEGCGGKPIEAVSDNT